MLFLLVGMIAYSQEPTPTKLETSKIAQNESAPKYKKADNKQNNTKDFSTFIKEIKAVSSNQKKEDQAKNSNEETALKGWSDGLIVLFTGILAISTIGLWWSTYKLWKISTKTIDLAKQEFIASHPPKLKVHSIAWHWYTETGKPWKIQCAITNIGGSAAIIKKSNLTFSKLEYQLPTILPFSQDNYMLGEEIVAPGEHIIGEITLNERVAAALNIKMWNTPRRDNEENPFYFFGYIDYWDNSGTARRTAFCRQLNIETYRFNVIQGDDYEYSY